MMKELPARYVCNNCAATKAGDKCEDCVGHGCMCTCQYPLSAPQAESVLSGKDAPDAEKWMRTLGFIKGPWSNAHVTKDAVISWMNGYAKVFAVSQTAAQPLPNPSGKDAAREFMGTPYVSMIVGAQYVDAFAKMNEFAASQTAALTKSWKAEELVWRQNDHDNKLKMQQMQAGAEILISQTAALRAERDQLNKQLRMAKIPSRTHSDESWRRKVVELEREISLLRAERDRLMDTNYELRHRDTSRCSFCQQLQGHSAECWTVEVTNKVAEQAKAISLLRERLQAEKEG